LLRASAACDRPEQARSIARLLACPAGLDLPEAASLAALAGTARERIVFDAGAAWFPWRSHALWFLRQMQRWRWIDPSCDVEAVARAVYRPDLLAGPARAEGRSWPARDRKPEGGHAGRWYLEAAPAALEMYPDRLCDGMTF
ncbi:MAG: nitrate ABC transporter substrate-binding protein, partial [Acetobacteraceae bacterium]|nr:nitrate ABC transporter substrate-binding protein [Acetobacteraceae bacterium]